MTPAQVKAEFEATGTPVSEWADKHGFPRDAVYRVLRGHAAGKRGRMHQIAVALGIKSKPAAQATPTA